MAERRRVPRHRSVSTGNAALCARQRRRLSTRIASTRSSDRHRRDADGWHECVVGAAARQRAPRRQLRRGRRQRAARRCDRANPARHYRIASQRLVGGVAAAIGGRHGAAERCRGGGARASRRRRVRIAARHAPLVARRRAPRRRAFLSHCRHRNAGLFAALNCSKYSLLILSLSLTQLYHHKSLTQQAASNGLRNTIEAFTSASGSLKVRCVAQETLDVIVDHCR
jgi:hypothetical protein